MALKFHPNPGAILSCDFDGLKEPEMVKRRPVIVLSPRLAGRDQLVTVVAVSSTPPRSPQNYHYRLPMAALPQIGAFQRHESWVKGDMVYTVGFHRLNLYLLNKRGPNGKRLYFKDRLSRETMREVYSCVLHGLGLRELPRYL